MAGRIRLASIAILSMALALVPTPTPSGAAVAEACTPTYTPGTLEVHFIDVGQGNSTLVIAPSGKTMLVDSGERVQALKVANYLLQTLCTKTIDYFVVSHYHADHFGSFVELLRNQGVTVTTATYDRGGGPDEYSSAIYAGYFDFCTTPNPADCKRTTIRELDIIDMGVGITVTVVCAGDITTRTSCGETIVSENDNNITLLVTYDTLDVWIGGDTSGDAARRSYADVEGAAVALGRVGPTLDVYGVDHHGSCHSTNDAFVNATVPTVSVFSLGRNSFGHPCPAVVDRLTIAGSATYYTRDSQGLVVDGDVVVKSAGGTTYTVTGTGGTFTFTTK